MARFIKQGIVRENASGAVSVGATITVNLAGSTAATIYSASSGGSAISGAQITTDSNGYYKFYVDNEDYTERQLFDMVLAKIGATPVTYPDLDIIDTALDEANVVDFGADITGATDSSTAFTEAAAKSKTVKLPSGTYRLDSDVTFTNVNVVGEDPTNTKINFYNASGTAITFNTTLSNYIGGFELIAQSTSQNGLLIKGSSPVARNIKIKEFEGTSLQLGVAGTAGTYYSDMSTIFILNVSNQGAIGVLVDGQSSPNSNANVLTSVGVVGRFTTLYHIKGSNNKFYGGDCSWNTGGTGVTDCIKIEGSGNVFDGPYMEAGAGVPTRFFQFTSTAYSNVIENTYLSSQAGNNMDAMTLDAGWNNRVKLLRIGFNFHDKNSGTNQDNLIPNSHFRHWVGTNPDGWASASGTIVQDSGTVRGGAYSLKMTAAADNPTIVSYIVGHASAVTPYTIADLQGQMVMASAWVNTAVADAGNIKIVVDGTGSGGYGNQTHSGGGGWELLTAMCLVPTDATYVRLQLRGMQTGTTTGDIYFNEPTLSIGHNLPFPQPAAIHDTYARMMGPFIGSPFIAFGSADATPSIADGNNFITGGADTYTDFDDGVESHEITIVAEHVVVITDGTNIFTPTGGNLTMNPTDVLTLIQKADGKWYTKNFSDNT